MGTNDHDVKKNCAREALKWIRNDTIVGLGGGSTVAHLIDFIREEKLRIKVVTPSLATRLLCIDRGLDVLYTGSVDRVAVAFDGCDEVDGQLNALKSGGGIHTEEKLIGSMADDYILLVDESKFAPKLTFSHPVVLEVLPTAMSYVRQKAIGLGGSPAFRKSSAKDGFTVTEGGNLLLDVAFAQVESAEELEHNLSRIRGVIDTSLFVGVATRALIACENGVRTLSRNGG